MTDLISQSLQALLKHLTPNSTPPAAAEPAPTPSTPVPTALVTLRLWIPHLALPDAYNENETAFSNTLHSETEKPQHSPPDIQTLTTEPLPSSPTLLKVCRHGPAWAHQMPQQYVMASGPSTNSLHLDMKIEMMDTQQTHGVIALLDSRATGLFLDSEFVKCHSLTTQPLSKPIPVYNIDGTPNKAGIINSVVNLVLCYQNYAECAMFAITSLDLDLLDPLPLTFPHREALYEDDQSGSRALEEECRREFGAVHELEFLDKAVEVGDWIYMTTVHLLPSIAEIWASQTMSQQLAQAFAANAMPQEFQDTVPSHLHIFEDVFSKALFDSLPECKRWDHTIELLPDSTPFSCKVYLLMPREQEELNAFLQENLDFGHICPSKSLMASPVFFIKKKDGLL
ncbi:hypothetical protein E4T56_gene18218 [Termitomyces sp. T112]|nr:hypothetical protein E4T56_gene18218 [Termitomyces sp. T112]